MNTQVTANGLRHEGPNRKQRRTAAKQFRDRSHLRKGATRMQLRAGERLTSITQGRQNIHKLFLRADISLNV